MHPELVYPNVLPGAVLGDPVAVAPTVEILPGMVVTSPGDVALRLCNVSLGTIDPADPISFNVIAFDWS